MLKFIPGLLVQRRTGWIMRLGLSTETALLVG
jgi:hypothetical protein